jgi:hypothetical protein
LIAAGTILTAGIAGLAMVALVFFSWRDPSEATPTSVAKGPDPATLPLSTLVASATPAASAQAVPSGGALGAPAVASQHRVGVGASLTQTEQARVGQGGPSQPGAAVKLTCTPRCSELDSITCDDQPLSLAEDHRLELASGNHRCVLSKAGYDSKILQLDLQPGELREATVRLARRQVGPSGAPPRRCGTFINPCK